MSRRPSQPPLGPLDLLPDVRDGLTRIERLILFELHRARREFRGRTVPTAVLYGRVVEHGVNITPQQIGLILARMGARPVQHGSRARL